MVNININNMIKNVEMLTPEQLDIEREVVFRAIRAESDTRYRAELFDQAVEKRLDELRGWKRYTFGPFTISWR